MASPPPEPLRQFDDLAGPLEPALRAVDGLCETYRQQTTSGGILPNTLESLRIELTYNSAAIEGNTLTLRETQLVVEGRSPGTAKPLREIYEARNHDRALRQVEQWAVSRPPAAPITERDILDVHEMLLADIDASSAGRFRTGRVLISGSRYVPPGAQKFDALLPAALALANRPGAHPLLQAAELHYNLVAVHPFADGNGRTARLLMNHALLRAGFPLVVVPVDRRADYLAALESANSGLCRPFAEFIIACADATLRRVLG